ncbi:MAG: glutathione peroxidase [Isosphaeraceae bacterium]
MLHRLIPLAFAALAVVLCSSAALAAGKDKPASVLDFSKKSIDGKTVDLASYKGDVLLIVNVASKCGYTPQYEGLESVFEKYKDKGFKVLAFPANEFGKQEPGNDAQIKEFCTKNYGVTFPVFSKIVVKGDGIDPLYQFLTSKATNPDHSGEIPWNFTKFLVNRNGEVVGRFAPKDAPESPKVTQAIEAALAEGK